MKICTRCGNEYNEDLTHCPKCGLGESRGTYRYTGNEDKSSFKTSNIKESVKTLNLPEISNPIKVLITFITMILPFLGQIIGLGLGIYYGRQQNKDTKEFGHTIIVFSLVVLILYIGLSIILGIIFIQIYNQLSVLIGG